MQGVMISEDAYSFILTFVSYNNASVINTYGLIVDKIIETAFGRNRMIIVEFETPVILTQQMFEDQVTLENLTEKTLADRSYYPNGTYAYSMSREGAVLKFMRPIQLHYMYLKQHRAPSYYMKKSYGHHEVKGYLGEKLVMQGTVVLFSNLWKQFSPSE
jgi:hypothetical protein